MAAVALALAAAASSASAAGVATAQVRGDRATQMLFDAVHTNDFAAAEAAVSAGADVEARDRWEISPVELAIDKGYFRIAHFLVSVRNSRTPGNEAGQARAQPSPAAVPAQRQAAPTEARRLVSAAPPAKTAAQPQKVAVQPQWPADKPNPFDPATPAFGTSLPVIAPAQTATSKGTGTDAGPMLATDEAIRRSQTLR